MSGSDTQAAFYYQNIVAALRCLELIEFGSPIIRLQLENPERGRHVDDVIVDLRDGIRYYQIKWSKDESNTYTLHNLISSDEDSGASASVSLLKQLAHGYLSIADKANAQVILFSTRKAGTSKQPAKGFDCSLQEFLADIGDNGREARRFDRAERGRSLVTF